MNGNLETVDEGVELGYRVNDSEWIPIAFYSPDTKRFDQNISVGELADNNLIIRGYSVPFCRNETHNVQLRLCGGEIMQDNSTLSFRWLQTVPSPVRRSVDEVSIDDVQIDLYSSTLQQVLFMDNFDNQMVIK